MVLLRQLLCFSFMVINFKALLLHTSLYSYDEVDILSALCSAESLPGYEN